MDALDIGILARIMSQLDRTADYGACSCVCRLWRDASPAVRPSKLDASLRGNLSNDDFISMMRWLRCRVMSLQHISIHCEKYQQTYSLLTGLASCKNLISVDIQSMNIFSEVCGLLPETITKLKIYMLISNDMTRRFPRLQELVLSDSARCSHLIKCKVDHLICKDPGEFAQIFPNLQEVERELDLRDLPELDRWPDLRTCRDQASIQAMLNLPSLTKLTLCIKRSSPPQLDQKSWAFIHKKNTVLVVKHAMNLLVSDCWDDHCQTTFS